jgi:hypothetical protein
MGQDEKLACNDLILKLQINYMVDSQVHLESLILVPKFTIIYNFMPWILFV